MVVPRVVCLLTGRIRCSVGDVIVEIIGPACQPSRLGRGTVIDVLIHWPRNMI